jgi:Predicted membrane protein
VQGLDRSRKTLAAALAALAGYVDAVGYLSADRYFVSFMSGNTTRLATDLIADRARAWIPALLITGFLTGVAAGSFIAHKAGKLRKPAVMMLVTVLLTTGSGLAALGYRAAMMACLVLAMGALNNALQRDETPVALTYLTGALVRIGQSIGAGLAGKAQAPAWPFAVMWAALSCGAAAGAIAFFIFGPPSLWIAAMSCTLMTLASWRISRSNRS